MNGNQRDRGIGITALLLLVGLSVGILVPGRAGSAATIKIGTSNTESGSFAVYNTAPGSNGTPVFNNGLMTSAGSSLFSVLTTVSPPSQSFAQTNTSSYSHTWTANVNNLPSSFGGAKFSTAASTALPNGGGSVNNLLGVSFNS
ncbi:MAG: hypothetical protein ACP5XB_05525 [Isosphaeraceae bacterium]